jgi:uncharacterized protein (TIGR02147 family)
MSKQPNLYEFSDYRIYLKTWLDWAKREGRSNLTKLAVVAQIHGTFLSHVLRGDKSLSLEQASLIAEHISLSRLEEDYFLILIHIDKAGNQRLKNYWLGKKKEIELEKNKLKSRLENHKELSSEDKAVFYSSWIYTAIWSATAIENGQSLQQLSDRFQLPRNKIEEVTSFLSQSGLCIEKKGVFHIGDVHFHIPNESPLVVKHHTNWRIKAMQKMDLRSHEELFFTAPMSISKKDFENIREKINRLIKEAVDIAKESAAEDVACLNIDFFKKI